MASGIYAIAHIGSLKLYVCDTSNITTCWPLILEQLNQGTYPDPLLQKAWQSEGGKRRFTFHTYQDIACDPEIIGIEQLTQQKSKEISR
ncbi:hypothetical protein [Lyngbya aestuarii]|uniref:hypothetical protein n=1 Tax=Lyngbya aestuarii TaxID=118322 RepID=UPI00403D5D8E